MKGLIVFPGCKPKEIALDGSLEALQSAVGGYIEPVYPFEDEVAIICNEEGKIRMMIPNRALYDEDGNVVDIICGTFLVVGLGIDNFCDLSEELMAKYKERFARPEAFYQKAGKIIVRYE